MNIGIDIDGVIQDTERAYRYYAEIYDMEHNNTGVFNRNAVKCQDRYCWSTDQSMDFMRMYSTLIQRNSPLMCGAKEVIKRLKDMGHKIIIISARGVWLNEELKNAEDLFVEHEIHVDKIELEAIDKLPICIENKIDVMIDDADFNIKRLSENGIKCLYLKDLFGEDVENENVTVVSNWGEILRYFLNK